MGVKGRGGGSPRSITRIGALGFDGGVSEPPLPPQSSQRQQPPTSGSNNISAKVLGRITGRVYTPSQQTMSLQSMTSSALAALFRSVYLARKQHARWRGKSSSVGEVGEAVERGPRSGSGRNILFITSDQQRYDALGVNGGKVARTASLDALAREGINYRRAHVQNVVCMPSRSTMLTGQHPHTHGVFANGVPLPPDAKSVASELRRRAGYHTALIGKAHFDPHLDPTLRFFENRCAAEGLTQPWHGFEHVELATHGPLVAHHYATWLWDNHPKEVHGFGGVLTGAGGGDTDAPEVAHNPIAREHYHTDWVAERTIAWLSQLPQDAPWFCWMSFPDPHHPFDPPYEEVKKRIDWRDAPLPAAYPRRREDARRILRGKPRHWLDWYEGRFRNPEGGPVLFEPASLSADQIREVNAMIHVENELIDEACGRVMAWLRERDLDDNTDIIFTSDHGELQGDFGLLFKGPYHVESLLRVPLIWRPAPAAASSSASSANVAPVAIDTPVGHVDLAPTLCSIAGIEPGDWMQGRALPITRDDERERVITTFDSQFPPSRHAPAHDLPRRLAVHRLRAALPRPRRRLPLLLDHLGSRPPHPPTTAAPKASSTISRAIRTSGATCGTTRHTAPAATSCSPISATTSRRYGSRRWRWRHRRRGRQRITTRFGRSVVGSHP